MYFSISPARCAVGVHQERKASIAAVIASSISSLVITGTSQSLASVEGSILYTVVTAAPVSAHRVEKGFKVDSRYFGRHDKISRIQR